MKIGLQIPRFSFDGGPAALAGTLRDVARAADEHGLASLWVMDHFFQIPMVGDAEEPMLEGYTALAFLAAHTRRISLGTLVTGVTYRHPGLLAKTVSTLDVLSGGRAWLGIGAAWFEREHRGLGVPFPPLGERFARLDEALRIVQQMHSAEVAPFEGRHYRLAETLNVPQLRDRVPILIGGLGEKKTLRLVAEYADACNLFTAIGPDALRHKLDVLRRHCDRAGRPFDEVEKTALHTWNWRKTPPAELVEQCRGWARLGLEHVIVNVPDVDALEPIEQLGKQVIPEVAGL